MRHCRQCSGALVALLLFANGPAAAQATIAAKSYPDGRGGEVRLPLGDLSFADQVVSFRAGDPSAAPEHSRPAEALGIANYQSAVDDEYLTLGCGGELVVRFTDNALGDVDGPDIFVFEIGPAVEPTALAISKDGTSWIAVGEIAGGVASIDIKGKANPFDTYSFLKLTDSRAGCFGEWPGADIDAIAAIGAGRRVVLDASLLFDFDESVLKPTAENALRELASEINAIPDSRVVLEGHTDSDGAEAYNQQLSEARAEAVRQFLIVSGGVRAEAVHARGYGESQPVAPNDTPLNKARNRRVEAVIIVE
jgi:outer membrane protein OmpA-like peptidoglycan-associated protein